MKHDTSEDLKSALRILGAREFEIVALSMNPDRGLAALAYAQAKGVEHPVPYAIKVFDSDWQPRPESRSLLRTNRAVNVTCHACGGDRFVLVTDGSGLYEETYAPCAVCNPKADTTRWVGSGRRVTVAR